MNDVQKRFARLHSLRILDFLKMNAEAQEVIRDTVKELCDAYSFADPSERKDIVSNVRSQFSFVFHWFAKIMAEEAIRELSSGKIWDGLMGLLVENYVLDSRETQIRLALLFHSAIKLNLDADRLFAHAASLAVDPDLEIAVGAFPLRPPGSRSLGVFFYEECGTGETFSYRKLNA
jgi:hypothetical protein